MWIVRFAVIAAMAIAVPAFAQQKNNSYDGPPLGINQGGEGNFSHSGSTTYRYSSGGQPQQPPANQGSGENPFKGWVFEDDKGASASGDKARKRDDRRRRGRNDQSDDDWVEADEDGNLIGRPGTGGGMVIEDRGQSSGTVIMDTPKGRIIRRD